MKQQIISFLSRIIPLIRLITNYSLTLFILAFAGLSGYLVMKVGSLSQAEPTQIQVDEKISETKQVKIDEGVLKVIETLKDRDNTGKSNFDTTRSNPFENR